MLPGSLVAAGLLLSLVPGWVFLRLTERARRPRHQSEIQEILELVAVGVLTTGSAVLLGALIHPSGLFNLDLPPEDANGVRDIAQTLVLVLITALLLAYAAARAVLGLTSAPQSSLVTSVWWDVFRAERVVAGNLPYVSVTKADGAVVEGVLETYTWQSDSAHHRDVALRAPIRFEAGTEPGTNKQLYRNTSYDFLVIPGTEIRQVAVQHVRA